MFTGLVEAVGVVRSRSGSSGGARISFAAPFTGYELGESISVNGACLTVARFHADHFEADVSSETLAKTTLGSLAAGAKVNLERATQAHGRLGGHFVLGHVDGVGKLIRKTAAGEATALTFQLGLELAPLVASKGSIALDGVSLTINKVTDGSDWVSVEVMIVPHTQSATTLTELSVGSRVNVEVDVLARYLARQLEFSRQRGALPLGSSRPHVASHTDAGDSPDDDARLLAALERNGYA